MTVMLCLRVEDWRRTARAGPQTPAPTMRILRGIVRIVVLIREGICNIRVLNDQALSTSVIDEVVENQGSMIWF